MATESAVAPPPETAPEHGGTSDGPQQSLWRHRDFNRLWLAQAVSAFGSQVTTLALPLTAVLYLDASATQIGVMAGARELAVLGLLLFFGVMVDRMRRRPLMIGADIGRAAVLAVVPVMVWTDTLSMPVLYVVAFVLGSLTVVFDLAYRAYLPSVVSSQDLLAGNSRLQTTDSVSEVAGPGLGGALVQLLRAPFALVVDALSFLFSAFVLTRIRTAEKVPERAGTEDSAGVRGVLRDIGAGLRFTFRHPLLRPLAGAAATFNFFSQLMLTLFVIYATVDVGMSAAQIGLVFAGFGIGGVIAAMTLGRTLDRLGYGGLLLAGYVVGIAAIMSIPLVSAGPAVSTMLYTGIFFLAGCGIVALNIVEMTLRQVIAPNAVQGRVNASFRFLIGGLLPIAAVLAGVLGDGFGLRETLVVTAVGIPCSLLWLVFSPVHKVRSPADLGTEA